MNNKNLEIPIKENLDPQYQEANFQLFTVISQYLSV